MDRSGAFHYSEGLDYDGVGEWAYCFPYSVECLALSTTRQLVWPSESDSSNG